MPVSGLSGASNDARQPNSPSPPGRGGAWPSASLLVGHSPLAGMLPPRASHLARRRSRQNRKLFLNRPEGAYPQGSVTEEQRSPRPFSAQPFGQQLFWPPASLLAPYRPLTGMLVARA